MWRWHGVCHRDRLEAMEVWMGNPVEVDSKSSKKMKVFQIAIYQRLQTFLDSHEHRRWFPFHFEVPFGCQFVRTPMKIIALMGESPKGQERCLVLDVPPVPVLTTKPHFMTISWPRSRQSPGTQTQRAHHCVGCVPLGWPASEITRFLWNSDFQWGF